MDLCSEWSRMFSHISELERPPWEMGGCRRGWGKRGGGAGLGWQLFLTGYILFCYNPDKLCFHKAGVDHAGCQRLGQSYSPLWISELARTYNQNLPMHVLGSLGGDILYSLARGTQGSLSDANCNSSTLLRISGSPGCSTFCHLYYYYYYYYY